ncbi:U2 small nuclear ribonucleoprotein B'' [Coemansia sp. RSA 552]|nr:U2 small nuclear ribonucleoprotein B'' [Coemansia sp. RSA 552]
MSSIPPSQTLYIRNLNDKIQKDTLKQTLYGLCIAYGRILDIVALKTQKMRGQAFVVFGDITAATAALRQLDGRRLFGRPMQIEYALSKSEVVAQSDGSFRFGEPRKHMSAVERKRLLGISGEVGEKRRQSSGDSEDAHATKRRVADQEAADESSDEDVGPAAPAHDAADLEPSATLFVTNLPDTVSMEMLAELFQQYAGFKEVRRIPGKDVMAFIDYASAEAATAARNVLDGFKLAADKAMNIAFSR